MSFFGATGTPVLDFCDVSSGFQSQSGFCLIRYFCGGECNVHSPRFTSSATLADLLVAGAQPVTSFTCMCRGGTWLRFERATARTEDERATIVPVPLYFSDGPRNVRIYLSPWTVTCSRSP